jgi:hypothetical protein
LSSVIARISRSIRAMHATSPRLMILHARRLSVFRFKQHLTIPAAPCAGPDDCSGFRAITTVFFVSLQRAAVNRRGGCLAEILHHAVVADDLMALVPVARG